MQPSEPVQPISLPAPQGSLNATVLLEHAAQLSRYVRRLVAHPPTLFAPAWLARPCSRCQIRAWLHADGVATEEQLHRRLRQVRQAALLQVITRDLNGLADLDEVMGTVTALAEETLRFALSRLHPLMQDAYGAPRGERSGLPQDQLALFGVTRVASASHV